MGRRLHDVKGSFLKLSIKIIKILVIFNFIYDVEVFDIHIFICNKS